MIKKRFTKIAFACALAVSMLVSSGFAPIKANAATDWNTARYGDKVDIGTKLRAQEDDPAARAQMDKALKAKTGKISLDDANSSADTSTSGDFTYDGGTKYFLGYDNVNGYYVKKFTLRSVGNNVEVWVAQDLAYGSGDTRPAQVVTQAQVDKLRDEFDNNILKKDTDFYGTPVSRSGANAQLPGILGLPQDYYTPSDGKDRAIMLVDNIKDENYYDPTYPFYVAGFFSPSYTRYFDRNIINIDSAKWDVRLDNNDIYSTIAHEFQHLIHRDNDPQEETWINEGMSDFAEYVCGYGFDWGHINYFLDHPENSLVSWDEYYNAPTGPETLADYGQALLLQVYLYDHYGASFIQSLAKDKDHGIVSLNKILRQYRTGIDFGELFRRFTIALSIDNAKPNNGAFLFKSLDVKVNYDKAQEYQKNGVPAWGADYIKLEDPSTIKDIEFNGVSFLHNPNPWQVVDDPLGSGDKVFWGNKVDDNDNKLAFDVNLRYAKKATLKFKTYYDIEETWDFGAVQVSTDKGRTWKSLSNADTRSDIDADGSDLAKKNLPGFTGTNKGWTQEQFDLSAYAGKDILVSFRYMTDEATTEAGWYINDIQVPEIKYTNDCSTLKNAVDLEKLMRQYIDYNVTFVNEIQTGGKTPGVSYNVLTLRP
ncbi:MAG: immune inhibitor A, partial [Bacillota bacterium]|nr:immune inhibitor A [Bacillota bacterium]